MPEPVTRKEFLEIVKEKTGVSSLAAADAVASQVIEAITTAASKGPLVLRGFGTFKTTMQPARTMRNPQTGAPVDVPAREKLSFKMSAKLRVD